MNFGNYSMITKKDAEIIIKDPTIMQIYQALLKIKLKNLTI